MCQVIDALSVQFLSGHSNFNLTRKIAETAFRFSIWSRYKHFETHTIHV